MFILSKLVWILTQPLSLAFLIGLIGVFSIAFDRKKTALFLGITATSVLFVTLFTTLGGWLIQDLEDRFPKPERLPEAPACMIVLGGGIDTEADSARGGYALNDDGDRYIETVRLARLYPNARIIMSGGDGSIDGGYVSEAEIIGRMFADFGIEAGRVRNDSTSRDTYENAVNTKAILEKEGLSKCLLITSGFHMPRSVAVFRQLGMDVIPWTTDYKSTGHQGLWFDFRYPVRNADMLTVAAKEWTGTIAYYARGRLSSIYPRP